MNNEQNSTDPCYSRDGNTDSPQVPDCPYGDDLTLDRIHKSWALGWVCLGCGRPVRITVEHAR